MMPARTDRNTTDTDHGANTGTNPRARDVLLDATREFCANRRPSRREIDRYRDLFYSLISKADAESKRQMAIAHANNAYTPRTVLYFLALDLPSVATPVLLFSPVFQETDLVSLAGRTTERHRQSISHRADLTPRVVEVLAASGERETLRLLSRNPKVLQNKESLTILENHLSKLVEADQSFGEDEAVTAESPAIQAMEEPGQETNPVAAKIAIGESTTLVEIGPASHPGTSQHPSLLNAVNEEASQANVANEDLMALASRGGRLGKGERAAKTAKALPDLHDRLLAAAWKSDEVEFDSILAVETQLSRAQVNGLCEDKSGRKLVHLLKALMVPHLLISRMVLLRIPEAGRNASAFKDLLAYADQLFVAMCQQEIIDQGGTLRTRWIEGGSHSTHRATAKANTPQSTAEAVPGNSLRAAMRSRAQVLNRAQKRKTFGRRNVAGGYI